jgi:hypothetical protein
MKKYRKKPLIVEAEQWFPGKRVEGVQKDFANLNYVITVSEQRVYLKPGDWIIKESDGIHYYPCDAAVFERTYEEV